MSGYAATATMPVNVIRVARGRATVITLFGGSGAARPARPIHLDGSARFRTFIPSAGAHILERKSGYPTGLNGRPMRQIARQESLDSGGFLCCPVRRDGCLLPQWSPSRADEIDNTPAPQRAAPLGRLHSA